MSSGTREPTAFWRGSRGIRKAELVPHHSSSDFVDAHYEVIRRLNSGSFAHVNLVRERGTDRLRVCKVISIKDMDPHVLRMMRKEVQVLSALDHPNIVKLYEFAEDERRQELVLILEYVEGGDCIDLMEAKQRLLPEKLVARLVHQLLVVLNYCHHNGITHRDVKPENVMLSSSCEDSAQCKVIDFGLATPYKGEVKEFAGTVSYLSPELAIAQAGFSMAADMWAVAATTFELLAGVAPFGKPQEYDMECQPILDKLCAYESFDQDLLGVFRQSPGHQKLWRSSEAKDFLRCMLVADPEERPTAAKALEHPWLAKHRPTGSGLASEEVPKNLTGFAQASQVHRSCLFALAAKGADESDIEHLGQAFVQADFDGDGRISREDLSAAIAQARSWWQWRKGPEFDVEAFFTAADQDKAGVLNYTELTAACLFGKYPSLDAKLMDRAFAALDHDRDGVLKADEVQPAFLRYPSGLPKYHGFKRDEWRECLLKEVSEEQQRSSENKKTKVSDEEREEEESQSELGPLRSFFGRFFLTGACQGTGRESSFDNGDELSVSTGLKPETPRVAKLRAEPACQLPAAVAASDMARAAMASGPPDPVAVAAGGDSFTALQAGANPSFPGLQPPKGLWGAAGQAVRPAGASFASASTFSSLSSMQQPGQLAPSRSSHLMGH
eukprot:TRINITY_DN11612_c1_g1_i2.p1 TRINITY_DN11612_c1_g1~~TRINITY_DN11612_c1_g1_i2.p1  ORF type:complete len:689 (+),score=139.74 TRINITY_DN11612_c1_g1_i2:61-2067(+)